MKRVFNAVIGVDHVVGALILDDQGKSVYDPLDMNPLGSDAAQRAWAALVQSDTSFRELDIVFENGRLYIRKVAPYFLLVRLDGRASTAPLKLICGQFTRIPGRRKLSGKLFDFLSATKKN